MAADGEGTAGQFAAVAQFTHPAFFGQYGLQRSVVVTARYDHYVGEVLGRGADEGDATDVDLFDDEVFFLGVGHRFFEGVEIDDDQVDLGDVVFSELAQVILLAAGQDPPVHFGVKRFHPAVENGRVAGKVFDGSDGYATILDEGFRTPGAVYSYALLIQRIHDRAEAILVVHGN